MNPISEQIFQTIDVLVDNKIHQLQFDKTIQATIQEVTNLDTGEYRVRYQGNIFLAYSNDLEKEYEVDDVVYVSVPEGNFGNRKLIISTVNAQSLSYGQLQQLKNTISSVSPSLTSMYQGVKQEPYKVIAGIEPSSDQGTDWIYRGLETYSATDPHGMFQKYISTNNLLRISASFMTQFHCTHTQGNYGIELEFYAKDETTVSFRLDFSSFNGNPYSFSVYAPQFAVVQLPRDYLLGLKSIKLFQEGFVPDRFVENGIVTEDENLTLPNIFCRDLSIDFVEIKDLTDASYYLKIGTPQGQILSNTVSSLDLVGELIYQGSDIMDSNKCACQWYIRDLNIMVGSEEYNRTAGVGWKALDNQTSLLHLTTTDVACKQNYKLIVVYNGNTTLSSEVEVTNSLSPYDLAVAQRTDGEKVILELTDKSLFGNWYMSFPDGSYLEVPSAKHTNAIIINSYLQYSTVTFYCSVETTDRKFLGTLDYVINNSNSDQDIMVTYRGEDTFQYDANGDTTIDEAARDRTLFATLAWKDGSATSYSIAWIMRTGNNQEVAIPRQKGYDPENSMLRALWVDNQNVLHYNIEQKYRVNYNNNTLILKVTTMFGESYFFEKEILFLKDGDQGTNGTSYIAAVRPCDEFGVKLSGVQPLTYSGTSWTNTLAVRCYVYKDGELINTAPNYTISYKWTGTNVQVTGDQDRVVLSGLDSGLQTWNYCIRVQTTILENPTQKRITIYTSYPIDIAVNGINYELIDIDEIPSYIKYSSSGVLPTFYDRSLVYRYNGEIHNELMSPLNSKVLNIKQDRSGNYYLDPTGQFTFEEDVNIGVLELRDPSSSERRLMHPIVMYLDTFGNEAINGWNGSELEIDEEDKHYLFAPQVGAGEKDGANRFTGVVMGKDSAQLDSRGNPIIGLYGYKAGDTTFGLKSDGTAFFGSARHGGRIIIDGNTAKIYGGNGGDNATGMTLTLADLNTNGVQGNAIKVGGGVFSVEYNGSMTATNATITGVLYAKEGRIGCTDPYSGGWIITRNRLYSGNGSSYVGLDSSTDPFAIWAGSSSPGRSYTAGTYWSMGHIDNPAPFVVTRDGFVYCRNAQIQGMITSSQGEIGGWTIDSRKLYNGIVGMASTGNAAFWVGTNFDENSTSGSDTTDGMYFLVTRQGKLYCKEAEVVGDITATELTCQKGTIGGWIITDTKLQSDSTKLNAKGSIETNKIILTEDSISDKLGTIGYMSGNDAQTQTDNIALWADPTKKNEIGVIVKSYYGNVRIDAARASASTAKGVFVVGGRFSVRTERGDDSWGDILLEASSIKLDTQPAYSHIRNDKIEVHSSRFTYNDSNVLTEASSLIQTMQEDIADCQETCERLDPAVGDLEAQINGLEGNIAGINSEISSLWAAINSIPSPSPEG